MMFHGGLEIQTITLSLINRTLYLILRDRDFQNYIDVQYTIDCEILLGSQSDSIFIVKR